MCIHTLGNNTGNSELQFFLLRRVSSFLKTLRTKTTTWRRYVHNGKDE